VNQEIRILTSADLTGIEAVRNGLMVIRDLAVDIGNQGIGFGGNNTVPTPSQSSNGGSIPVPQPYSESNTIHSTVPTPEQINIPGYNVSNGIYVPQSYQPIAPPGIANHVPMPEQINTPTSRQPRQPPTLWTSAQHFQNAFQGRGGMSSWSEEGMAGAAGSLLTRALPIAGPLAAGLAIGGAVTDSYDKYKDSGDALSSLTKQILSTHDSLESLQKSVNGAGAVMAMSADQTARVANALGGAYGSLSMTDLTSKVSMVGGMALGYGANADTLSQGFAGAARLGMTTGPGSSMNQGQLAFGLANSASQSGMSGRMEELMQEVLSVTQAIQSTAVTSNPSTLLGIITAMNANLPRSMQGDGGSAVLGQISSSMASPNGLQQVVNYQAMSGAGVKGYFNIMRDQQMGPGFVLPNGQTNAEAMFGQYNKMFGSNPDEESYFLSKGTGMTMPQSDEMMKIFGKGGTGIKGLQNNLGITPDQLKDADWNKLALFGKLGAAKSGDDMQSVQNDFIASGGNLTEDQKTALTRGDLSQQKKRLAQDILGNGNTSAKTSTEKIDTIKADVTNLQITIAGSTLKDLLFPPASPPTKNNVDDAIKNAQAFGYGTVQPPPGSTPAGDGYTPTSYTPGGYAYSNAITATAMGMNGMNNAFSWLSNKGTGQRGGAIQVSTSDGPTIHSVDSSPRFSSDNPNAKEFTTKMFPYAQDASQKTGLPASFIIGEWGEESAWGSSPLAKNNNNFGGIKNIDGNYEDYSSVSGFSDAYSAVINHSRYAGAREAGRNGADAKTIGDLLHQEGYAEDPKYGSTIAGFVSTSAKSMTLDISDSSLAKLSSAIASAILGSGGNWNANSR